MSSWVRVCLVCLALLSPCRGFGERLALLRQVHQLEPSACVGDVKEHDDRSCPQDAVEQDEYVDAYGGCTPMGSFVQKIDYGPLTPAENHVMPSSSACLRCGICLAVAEQLNDTLTKAQNKNTIHYASTSFLFDFGPDDSEEVELEPEVVTRVLRETCETGFLNYGLREYKGERYVTEALPFTDHVPTALDGTWTENLRWMCRVYLSEYGEFNLYKSWLGQGDRPPPRDLTTHLCRYRGIFRDCMNLDIEDYSTTSKLFRNLKRPACL